MANIQPEIDDFRTATYGEEVRDSMISLAEKLNHEVETGTTNINNQTEIITGKVTAADTAIANANTAINRMTELRDSVETAESVRISAENTRISNENTRKTNETSRINAENTRVSDESTRKTNETSRINAENTRASNESTRNNNETSRLTAEADRVNNERNRVTDEGIRSSSEATRVANENQRISNEQSREASEDIRRTNEIDRQHRFNDMIIGVIAPATSTTPGVVIVGDGLRYDSDGRISIIGAGDLETVTHAEATYAKIAALNDLQSSLNNYILKTAMGKGVKFEDNKLRIDPAITWNDLTS